MNHHGIVIAGAFLACTPFLTCWTAATARAQNLQQLGSLSLAELGQIDVTTVAKSAQPVNDAPAAIYVITRDEILRSGAATLPEMLRLAPNLEVTQVSAYAYQITARGMNADDNVGQSDKLLVLIDGRTVYSPMFGGVYWDMQVVEPEDIERIEVVSGPGAALWGVNAVNGVVNIITRKSSYTQGGDVAVRLGSLQRGVSAQYGGAITPDLTYRVLGNLDSFSAFPLANGHSDNDAWWRPSGDARIDWAPGADTLSLDANIMTADENPNGFVRGDSVTAAYSHAFSGDSSLNVLAYYDNETRTVQQGPGFSVNTYDLEAQHSFSLGSANSIVWGIGGRIYRYTFENIALALVPTSATIDTADLFGQDTITLLPTLKATLGLKLEAEAYGSGLQPMPSIRVAYKPVQSLLLWAAISRALNSVTPVDVALREFAGPFDILNGADNFRPETLVAYEAGIRAQPWSRLSFSADIYHDVYTDLRSIERAPPGSASIFVLGNRTAGSINGVEVWGSWQVVSWWRLSAGFDLLQDNFRFLPGALTSIGVQFTEDDPNHQVSLHSGMNLTSALTWDAYVREVGALPHPVVPGYTELDTTVAYAVTPRLRLTLSGENLLQPRHTELAQPGTIPVQVPRSVLLQARLAF